MGPARLARQVVEDQLRPGLHVQVVAAHGLEWEERTGELVHLADRDLGPVSFNQEDQPEMHPADVGGLVIDGAEQLVTDRALVDNLLLPFAAQSRVDRVGRAVDILRVDVSPHSERVEVAKPPLARPAQAVGEEVPVLVAEDNVGNDLRLSRVFLNLAARTKVVPAPDPLKKRIQPGVPKTTPLSLRKEKRPGHDQNILAGGHDLSVRSAGRHPASFSQPMIRAMDPVSLVRRTALFDGFSPADLEELAPGIKVRPYARGAYIFHEGDAGHSLFVLSKGQVKIGRMGRSGEEVVFAVLAPGDSFGELALFDQESRRTADAQAMELTECVVIDRDALLTFLDRHPEFARRVLQMVSRYVRATDEAFAEAAFLDIPGRVASKLLELAASRGEPAGAGTRITVRLPQRTLAGMIGASRENVNRALSRLTAEGTITQANGYITVVHAGRLRART